MALKNFSGLAELVKATWFPAARTVYDAAATRVQRSGEHRIIGPRFTGRWGAHRIDWHLHIPRSTVGRVLGGRPPLRTPGAPPLHRRAGPGLLHLGRG